jgi:hypothetical protein
MAGFQRGEGRAWPGKGGGVVPAHLGFDYDGGKVGGGADGDP